MADRQNGLWFEAQLVKWFDFMLLFLSARGANFPKESAGHHHQENNIYLSWPVFIRLLLAVQSHRRPLFVCVLMVSWLLLVRSWCSNKLVHQFVLLHPPCGLFFLLFSVSQTLPTQTDRQTDHKTKQKTLAKINKNGNKKYQINKKISNVLSAGQ